MNPTPGTYRTIRIEFVTPTNEFLLWFFCPGCDGAHAIPITGLRAWAFDGNYDSPTLSPSLLTYKTNVSPQCHSFIRAGQIQFLQDCGHALAGQTVDLQPLPDWLRVG